MICIYHLISNFSTSRTFSANNFNFVFRDSNHVSRFHLILSISLVSWLHTSINSAKKS